MRGTVLNGNDPGLYRTHRGGRTGSHPLMVPEGPRTPITTGEQRLPPPESHPATSAAAFDPWSPGLGVIVLLALLLVINARFTAGATLGVGTKS